MSIMIVDDDEEYLSYVGMAVKAIGLDPVLVSSSSEACKLLEEKKYALVVTDLVMPFKTGVDILELARQKDPLAVVIITTAFGSFETAIDALRKGVYDYLFKPSSQDVIQAAVRRGLEYYELRRKVLEQASQIDTLKNKYMGSAGLMHEVSHAMRNPLTSIYGYSTYLSEVGPQGVRPEEFQNSLRSISKNVERMTQLLDKFDGMS
jgi:DNA-binding NtrC family response regulator